MPDAPRSVVEQRLERRRVAIAAAERDAEQDPRLPGLEVAGRDPAALPELGHRRHAPAADAGRLDDEHPGPVARSSASSSPGVG